MIDAYPHHVVGVFVGASDTTAIMFVKQMVRTLWSNGVRPRFYRSDQMLLANAQLQFEQWKILTPLLIFEISGYVSTPGMQMELQVMAGAEVKTTIRMGMLARVKVLIRREMWEVIICVLGEELREEEADEVEMGL